MVTKVSPTRLVYNSAQNIYAVLVQRTASSFYYVTANGGGNILPPPYSHRYGAEYSTLQQGLDNIPSGFAIVTPPEACNLSIGVAVTIFLGIHISVYGSPTGASSWTLQLSTNGTTFTNVKTVTQLLPNGSSGVQGDTTADGEIEYSVAATGTYYFRVTSSNCTSNIVSRALVSFEDSQTPVSQGFALTVTSLFDLGVGAPFQSFTDSWGVAGKTQAEMQNVSALQGFDYLPMTGRFEVSTEGGGISREVFRSWIQKSISFPSTLNNVVQEGNKTYYFRPPTYTADPSYNMYDFHKKFPAFTPPTGKIVAIQPAPFSDTEQAQMISRGVTHVRRGVPEANRVFFWGDEWLNDVKDVNGQSIFLPPAYQEPESARQNFYNILDPYQMAAQLYAQFQLNNLLGYGYIFWNYERVATWDDRVGTWGNVQPRSGDTGKPKRLIFFEEFARLKPSTLKFVAWTKKPVIIDAAWQQQNLKIAWDAVYNGTATTYAQLDSVYAANNLTPRAFQNGVSGVSPMDFYHTGFYQAGHKIYVEFLYKHIMETYINKRLQGAGKKSIGTLWIDNETLASNDVLTETKAITHFGETLNLNIKPVASYSYMQSFAAWMTAIGDGVDVWEYREFLEDKATWDKLKNPSNEFQPPQFPYTSAKGVDWVMSAIWSLAQNDDILTAATPWVFPVDPFTAAGGVIGAGAKAPLVAWKLNAAGNVALVLAMNAYNDNMGLQDVSVIINGTAHAVKIHYKFTSIVRINL